MVNHHEKNTNTIWDNICLLFPSILSKSKKRRFYLKQPLEYSGANSQFQGGYQWYAALLAYVVWEMIQFDARIFLVWCFNHQPEIIPWKWGSHGPKFEKKKTNNEPLLMAEILLTTWDVWNLKNNGINYLSTGAGFVPSTVWPWKSLVVLNKYII